MQLGEISLQSHSGTLGPKMFGVGDFWLSLTRLFYGSHLIIFVAYYMKEIFQGAFERISEVLMTNFWWNFICLDSQNTMISFGIRPNYLWAATFTLLQPEGILCSPYRDSQPTFKQFLRAYFVDFCPEIYLFRTHHRKFSINKLTL